MLSFLKKVIALNVKGFRDGKKKNQIFCANVAEEQMGAWISNFEVGKRSS